MANYLGAGGGYLAPPKPKKAGSSLAEALSGYPILGGSSDTFGLQHPRGIDVGGLFPQTPTAYKPQAPVQKVQTPRITPTVTPTADTSYQTQTINAPTISAPAQTFDLKTDPALQAAYAYTGRSDEDARAQAVADRTRLVEQAGLSNLAAALGLGSDVAQVAASNPFSSAANLKHSLTENEDQLQTSFDRGQQDVSHSLATALGNLARQNTEDTHDFNQQANAQNLFYSGYRQKQLGKQADAYNRAVGEQNYQADTAKSRAKTDLATALAAQTRGYQQALADLAAQVQNQGGSISNALAAALGQNLQQRIAAEQAARDRAIQLALSSGQVFTGRYDGNGNPIFTTPSSGSSGSGGGGGSTPPDETPGLATSILNAAPATQLATPSTSIRYRRIQ